MMGRTGDERVWWLWGPLRLALESALSTSNRRVAVLRAVLLSSPSHPRRWRSIPNTLPHKRRFPAGSHQPLANRLARNRHRVGIRFGTFAVEGHTLLAQKHERVQPGVKLAARPVIFVGAEFAEFGDSSTISSPANSWAMRCAATRRGRWCVSRIHSLSKLDDFFAVKPQTTLASQRLEECSDDQLVERA